MTRLRPSRRLAALALAGLALAGLSAASASQLSVDGSAVRAGVGAVVDCQPAAQAVAVTFTSSSVAAPTGRRAARSATSPRRARERPTASRSSRRAAWPST